MSFEPFKIWEDINKLAEISEDLRDELETEEFRVQNIVSDTGYKWWVHIKPNIEYGVGEIGNPQFTLTTTEEWWIKILNKEIKGGQAYGQGHLSIDGNFGYAISYGSFLGVVNIIAEEIAEENAKP